MRKNLQLKDYPEFKAFLKSLPYPCEYTYKDLLEIAKRDYNLILSKTQIQECLRRLDVHLGHGKARRHPVGAVRTATRGAKSQAKTRLEIKMPNGTWKPYHVYLWEKANGKLPENCFLLFLDGNPLNCELDNLYCVTHQERMTYVGKGLYKYKHLGAEAVKTALMLAKLEVQLKKNS